MAIMFQPAAMNDPLDIN